MERNFRHILRLGKAKIDSYSGLTVLAWLQAAPANKVAAKPAEIEGDGAGPADIGAENAARIVYMDSVALMLVGPEYSIATADRAVADRRIGNDSPKLPMHSAAMT